MRFRTCSLLLLVALALGAVPAMAQESGPVEITPYIAFGTPGASPAGAMVTFPVTATISAETEVAYRRGEGNLPALGASVSLLKFLPKIGRATPYLAAGVGASQYGAPVLSANGPPIGTASRLAMTVNAGAGFKVPVGTSMDLRTDARWFQSIGAPGSEQFRIAQGISFDVARGK